MKVNTDCFKLRLWQHHPGGFTPLVGENMETKCGNHVIIIEGTVQSKAVLKLYT